MTARGVTLRGRVAAEARMVDTCSIVRPSGTHTTDPVTGVVTYPGTSQYTGKCHVQMMSGTRGDALEQAGERAFVVQSAVISVPVAAAGLLVGDMVTVTAATLDPDLVNRVYRIQDVTHKTHLTARRLICQEVTG